MTTIAAGAARLLAAGETCWRIADADRAAVLIDGQAYFRALKAALLRAQHSVVIVGWDIHSRVRLEPDAPDGEVPDELHRLLRYIVGRRPKLHVYILIWDWLLLHGLDRERWPAYRFGRLHRRIHFRLDGNHPTGACHHQKLVAIDDRLAFVGGLDVTARRWDERAHVPLEARRVDPDGKPYPPFHDLMLAVDGPAAAAIGELARERWFHATGRLLKPRPGDADPWPAELEPGFRAVPVGIARTLPAWEDATGAREVESLHIAAIHAARRFVYIENQYLTAVSVRDALAARLAEADGPEVVIVGTRLCEGMLETAVMEQGRAHLLARLRAADRFGRLRALYPVVPGEVSVNVHSKLTIIDDRLLRIGSANLANRSMGLDTECDLAIEAMPGDAATARAIAAVRADLLAEHLGRSPAEVARQLEETGSLIATIERLNGGPRRLDEIRSEPSDLLAVAATLADPDGPLEPEQLAERLLPRPRRRRLGGPMLRLGAVLLALVALAVGWRYTPLADLLDIESTLRHGQEYGLSPLGAAAVLGAFVLGGLVLMPVMLLITTTGMLLGPVLGFVYALAGSLASAALVFLIGQYLGRDGVRRLVGRRLNAVGRRLARHGIAAVVLVRLMPVAPYSVVNLVAGVSHLRLRDFLVGTGLGMAPGTAALVIFGDQLEEVLKRPEPENVLALALVAAALVLGAFALLRWSRRRSG